jgi:hypothetical protein
VPDGDWVWDYDLPDHIFEALAERIKREADTYENYLKRPKESRERWEAGHELRKVLSKYSFFLQSDVDRAKHAHELRAYLHEWQERDSARRHPWIDDRTIVLLFYFASTMLDIIQPDNKPLSALEAEQDVRRGSKLENSITENETPLTTEADDALIFPNFLLPSFDIQESSNPKYWFLCCRTCKLTWYLPKNPTRRTKDAVTILAAHADTHRESGSQCVIEPVPGSACRVCGGTNGPFERVTYAGAPDGGVPVHFDCVAAFFEQLDGRAPVREHVKRSAGAIPTARRAAR